MQHALDTFLSIAAHHPAAALAFVGLVAFAESIAILGTLVPAAVVMFGAGALAGHGALDLAATLAVAACGAVAGDAVSYELGRRQQERVRSWRLFRRYAQAMGHAEDLVRRHGAASVMIARFTGAVRAFVPLLAGFARMPAAKFYATNVVSALLWAPAHILPGVVFGASLHLAEAASGRLVMLFLVLALLLWSAAWLAAFTIRTLVPLARAARGRTLRAAGTRKATWARLVRLLLDPDRPGSQALLAGLVLLLACMWLFLGLVEDVVSLDPLVLADQAVFTFLQQMRTDPADRVMVAITEMGSVGVLLPLVAAVALALAWRRCWRTGGYWLATVASAELVVQVLKHTLGRHRPLSLYQGIEQFSFPSGHATMSAVVLAYLAFLVTRGQPAWWRIGVGAAAAIYVALVGFSRLYLGAHWLSDVLGGFSFGLAAVALSAMVYTQHRVQEDFGPRRLALVAATVIAAAGAAWIAWHGPADGKRYAAVAATQPTTLQAWADGGFRLLAAQRREFAGERKETFTIQVACGEAALRAALARAGWTDAPALSLRTALLAIAPHPELRELPVLPRYDGGRRSGLNLVGPGSPVSRDVLRLWRSEWQLPGGEPVWYGAFYREVQVRPGFSVVRQQAVDAGGFAAAFARAGLTRLPHPGSPALWTCAQPPAAAPLR